MLPYALVGDVLPIIFLIFALKISGDGAAVALAMQMVPVFAVIIAVLALHENAPPITWIGVALSALGGAALVFSANAVTSLGGMALAIAAAAFYGTSQVVLRRLQTVSAT